MINSSIILFSILFLAHFLYFTHCDDGDRTPSLQKQVWANEAVCGDYLNSTVSSARGNEGLEFFTVKIHRQHLVGPPYTVDNTMATGTGCAYSLMRNAAAADGVELLIDSAFRSLARQQYFWYCYRSQSCNDGNLAAVPGTSNHGYGLALDLNSDYQNSTQYGWLKQNGVRFGFIRTVPEENWHFEYRPGMPAPSYT